MSPIYIKKVCPINGSQSTNIELFTDIFFFFLKIYHGVGVHRKRELVNYALNSSVSGFW